MPPLFFEVVETYLENRESGVGSREWGKKFFHFASGELPFMVCLVKLKAS